MTPNRRERCEADTEEQRKHLAAKIRDLPWCDGGWDD